MPFCIENLLFPSTVRLGNLFSAVDRDLVRMQARRPRNERYFSKQNFVQNKKCIRFLVYVALLFVCQANSNHPNHPNRSTLSFPISNDRAGSSSARSRVHRAIIVHWLL
jgi:hypothetical protein